MDRVKNLSEDEIANSHYNATDMKRRLKKYRDVNESKVAEPSVMQFFREHNIQLFQKDAGCPEDTIFNSFKIYIERVSKLLICMLYYYIYRLESQITLETMTSPLKLTDAFSLKEKYLMFLFLKSNTPTRKTVLREN